MTTTFTDKDPAEIIFYGIDFADLLGATETISSATPSLRALIRDDPGTAAMLSGAAVIDGTTVKQLVSAGLAGNTYRLGVTIVTSLGQVFVEAGDITVVDRD